MAADAQIQQLKNEIRAVLVHDRESLIRRPKWGEISFEPAKRDIDRVFDLLQYLDVLPLEYIPDGIISQIINAILSTKTQIERIDKFNIQESNPGAVKNDLVAQIHTQADGLYTCASIWVPFLAYQKGDVATNISQLTRAVEEAGKIIDDAKAQIELKNREVDIIVTKAREASGKAGAGVFTEDFQRESIANLGRARVWLRSTWILALVTLIAAGLMWLLAEPNLDDKLLWQKLSTKLAVLVLMLSATGWCAKIYKALLHQSTVNRHRALSLQTFQAFSSAASDPQTKDAVLMQATKSIFSDMGTGLVDTSSASGEGEVKILEVMKSFMPK